MTQDSAPTHRERRKAELLMQRAEGLLLSDTLRAGFASHLQSEAALDEARSLSRERPALGLEPRLLHLERARRSSEEFKEYKNQFGCIGVQAFRSSGGERIYRMPAETFPRHINNIYCIVSASGAHLLDAGSGLDTSRRDIALGFAAIRELYGERVHFEELDTAIISHAHIDHFGGVNDLIANSKANICVHELDARVLCGFEERVVVAVKDVEVFLRRAGVDEEAQKRLISLYMASRDRFRSIEVGQTLRDGDRIASEYEIIHTPGHCPGQICLRVGDVLLTSDHILSRITPHQFPQAITPFAGLGHYFHSLEKVRRLSGIRLALGGHEEPIHDIRGRIDEIAAFHHARLNEVLSICGEAKTISEVTSALFGTQTGYGELLAIEEAGAHVEYLHDLGRLCIANLNEVAASRDPVILYQKRA